MVETRHIAELFRHRQLVAALVTRELKGRYRDSVLGFLWTFLNPLLLLLVYYLVFKVYLRVQMEHYDVYMFTGLLPWIFFSQSLMEGAGAVVDSGSMVTKVLFPMQVLPAYRVLGNFINYLLSLPILLAFLLITGKGLTWYALLFPVVAASHLLFVGGAALLLCTTCVFMRDTRHILGNLLTLWFFVTPILYDLQTVIGNVPEKLRFILYWNPAAIYTMAYQDIFFWGRMPDWTYLGGITAFSIVMLSAAIRIFETYKEYFAEKI